MEVPEDQFDDEMFFWYMKVALVGVQLVHLALLLKKRAARRRSRPVGRRWTLPYCRRGMFEQFSAYNLIKEAALNDGVTFFNQMRMSPTHFEVLAQDLGQVVWYRKKDTRMRKCIPLGNTFCYYTLHLWLFMSLLTAAVPFTGARLALSLRYYATGDNLHSLATAFRIGHSTAASIVVDTAKALYEALQPKYLKEPTEADWKRIATGFYSKWNCPNCYAAMDGKHLGIICPAHSGKKKI